MGAAVIIIAVVLGIILLGIFHSRHQMSYAELMLKYDVDKEELSTSERQELYDIYLGYWYSKEEHKFDCKLNVELIKHRRNEREPQQNQDPEVLG